MGQMRRPPRTSGAKPGLRWQSRRIPEDGGGCSGRRRRRATTDTLAQADAQACRDEDKRDEEGGPCDVEGPAGHVGAQGGSAVRVAQLSELLEIGQVRMMKTKLADVFEGLGHLLHFSGWEEVDGVPVPLVMEDAVI
jgi:hypothetical protein